LDVVYAKARFAQTIQGSEPGPSETGELVLRGLQHPLLTLRQISVVPNDLFLEPDERILVISGPNAGGKTVLLKALGLAILMERAGLHIPAVPGSRIPPFDGIYADIGDQQDILRDVSTFSGHIEHVREILRMANDRSLVILDELAGSTDPQEGTSLALAILEDLYERGSCVLVSTHYPAIKAWAQGHPHVRNAAMEFNWTRMEPTYKLRAGVPGQSSALEIARRIGLPEGLMERAKRHLHGQQTDLDYLLQELQEQRSALEEDKRQVSILRKRHQEEMSEREELNRSLRQERDDFVRAKKKRLATEIKEARHRVREVMKTIAKARTPADVQRARENIRILEDEMRPAPSLICDPPRPLGQVRPGDPVEIVPLGKRGILLDDPEEKHGRLRVKVGSMEIHVDQHALGGVDPEETSSQKPQQTTSIRAPKAVETSSQIDLRGMKVDDAMETIERYMDQTLMGQRDEVRIIHGHGTGALKKAVREWLSNCAFVEDYRPGDRFEGGDGATIVRLRNQYNHT
jgi:DNA mismatch repair protein MutS2